MTTYRTVPFNPDLSEKEASRKGAETIAQQLQELINREAAGGWRFVSYETVQVSVNPGCLAALVGGKPSTVLYGTAIFARET